ncbi:helix-turn-helix transcriptional regulator [Anaerospora hongkongensis]|uniref:helix-turn-helix transcriptional regulator n=1 Tax=Anaerospora hongkongensis TaxID=244830 RepID=UPI002FDB61F1
MFKDFGKRIAKLRNKKGMSQAELGKMMGLAQATIGAWEVGRLKTLPDDETLLKLATLLGTKVETLLGADELVLDRFDPVVAQWLTTEEAVDFVNIAFMEWAKSKANRK